MDERKLIDYKRNDVRKLRFLPKKQAEKAKNKAKMNFQKINTAFLERKSGLLNLKVSTTFPKNQPALSLN